MGATSVDNAVAALRSLITTRGLRPGERLPPERELADQLGLARPTVREAVKRLNESGLLESRPRSGTYVATVDLPALFQVRMRLEPLAARLAAAQRSAADLAEMQRLVREMRAQIGDRPGFAELDARLHSAIWKASGNALLMDLLDRLLEASRLSRSVTSPTQQARRAALADLRRLVAAIRRRDADLAEQAMTSHLAGIEGHGA